MSWLYENLHGSWTQGFEIDHVHFDLKTDHQHLIIFENKQWGRVLALDEIIQTTTGDEAHYHEMLMHVPIRAHGNVRKVLIVGGGDGGSLRECLRYPDIEAVQVEIDQSVIDLCVEQLPSISNGAFDNPRAEIVIADGARFMAETDRKFDVIAIDSTDPIGPGEVLFRESFYRDCRRCLTDGGVLATQLGNPRMSPEELEIALARLNGAGFACVDYYLTDVPTYVGGSMSLGFATDNPEILDRRTESLAMPEIDQALTYYTPRIHAASFAHPAWMVKRFGA